MVLSNTINKKSERGFTIVELLIVIVVIAILAAITIVAYSGITARANLSKAQANAESAQKVAEAMNADNGFYPALAVGTQAAFGFTGGSTSTQLPSGMSIKPDAATTTINATNGATTVAYRCLITCTASTGGAIGYWNFTSGAENFVYVGAASGTATAPTGTYVYPAT